MKVDVNFFLCSWYQITSNYVFNNLRSLRNYSVLELAEHLTKRKENI